MDSPKVVFSSVKKWSPMVAVSEMDLESVTNGSVQRPFQSASFSEHILCARG